LGFVGSVFANIPNVTRVVVWPSGGDAILNVTVNHSPETPSHHVDLIEVDVAGDIKEFAVDVQPFQTFTIACNIGLVEGTRSVTVRARCTVDGYGPWYGPMEVFPTLPDFEVLQGDVSFDPSHIYSCTPVNIKADITNLGACWVNMSENGDNVGYQFDAKDTEAEIEMIDWRTRVRATSKTGAESHITLSMTISPGYQGVPITWNAEITSTEGWVIKSPGAAKEIDPGIQSLQISLTAGAELGELDVDWIELSQTGTSKILLEAEDYKSAISNGVNDIFPHDVVVGFYDGDPNNGGALISYDNTFGATNYVHDLGRDVYYLKNNAVATASDGWIACPRGEHVIYVVVDPAKAVKEANEANNKAEKTVYVDVSSQWRFPSLDALWMVVCNNEADMVTKAQAGLIDVAKDLENPDWVALLQGLDWDISTNINYECGYLEINCRDVTPPESGLYYNYHDRVPGMSLFPLNVSEFRFALHLLIGGSVTDNALSEVFGWTKMRLDTVLSPAYGDWYDPELPPVPLDPVGAMELLASVGIVNDTGYWRNTNAAIGPVGELRTMYVLGCPEEVSSTTAMSMRYLAEWNKFFGEKGDGVSNYFEFDFIPYVDMTAIVFRDRDFDICGLEFPLVGKCMTWPISGRDPDWLFDLFHSSKDGEDDYNVPGIAYPELDELLFAIKYWRWPDGTYITTIDEMRTVVWTAQEYLYYLTPCIPMYFKTCVNAFANCRYPVPPVMSWTESFGYGSDNWWTYNFMMWENPTYTGPMRIGVPGPVGTLNPGKANTANEWEILGRIYDGLLAVNPFQHQDVNWAMSGYEITPWTEEGVVDFGQKVTVHLRHGIYWHDGDPYTTADLKFNYDFIQNAEFGRYSDVLLTYHNTTIIDDYTCEIYIKCTGIWTVYAYFGSAMIFPENVWGVFWDDPAAAAAFTPWTENYDTYTGSTGHGALTCLIGTGPWIFTDWNQVAGVVPLIANRPDAVWAGNPGYWAYWFLRDDMNFDGIVNLFDAVKLAGAAGAEPGNPRWNYGQADITADYIVDLFDAVRLSSHAGWITLPH
jgi:ABC-type transport system substrate-binding protein